MSDAAQPQNETERQAVAKYGRGDPARVAKVLARTRELMAKAPGAAPAEAVQGGPSMLERAGRYGAGVAGALAFPAAAVPAMIAGTASAAGLVEPSTLRRGADAAAGAIGNAAVEMTKEELARAPARLAAPLGGPMIEAPVGQVIRDQIGGASRASQPGLADVFSGRDRPRTVAESVQEGQLKGAAETALSVVGEGLGRAVGYAGRVLGGTRGVSRLASDVGGAARAAEESRATEAARAAMAAGRAPEKLGRAPAAKTFYEKSLEITKDAGAEIFSAAEKTGDPSIALAESKALQFPKTMREAQAQRAARLQNTAKYLDGQTNRLAADPSMLGREDVSAAFAGGVERHLSDLRAARSAEARPLYDQAEKLLGDKKIAPIDEATAFISSELDRAVGPFQASRAPLKSTLEALQGSSKGGFASIKTVRSLAESWGQQAEGTGDLLKDLPISQRKYIASKMSEILNRSIDSAAESGAASDLGIQTLRKAQAAWAKHSQAIESLPLEAIGKVLKVGGGEAGDTLADRMMALSPEQLRGVFRVARRGDPAAAQQLGAEMVERELVAAGKPPRGPSLSADVTSELRPGMALSRLLKIQPKLIAIHEGDAESMKALGRIMDTLKRKSVGPGLRGSQTAPLIAQAMEEAGVSAAAAAAGPQAAGLAAVLKGLLGSDRALATAVTDPAKVRLLDEAIQAQLGITKGSNVSAATLRGLMMTANRLGVLEVADRRRQSQPPPMYYPGGKP